MVITAVALTPNFARENLTINLTILNQGMHSVALLFWLQTIKDCPNPFYAHLSCIEIDGDTSLGLASVQKRTFHRGQAETVLSSNRVFLRLFFTLDFWEVIPTASLSTLDVSFRH